MAVPSAGARSIPVAVYDGESASVTATAPDPPFDLFEILLRTLKFVVVVGLLFLAAFLVVCGFGLLAAFFEYDALSRNSFALAQRAFSRVESA